MYQLRAKFRKIRKKRTYSKKVVFLDSFPATPSLLPALYFAVLLGSRLLLTWCADEVLDIK